MPLYKFEWDEEKRRSTINKHGIDFVDAKLIFAERCQRVNVPSYQQSEERWIVIGKLNDLLLPVVVTIRNENIRIITGCRSSKFEKNLYHDQFR